MSLAFLERNGSLTKTTRFRSRLAGDPRFDGLEAIGTQRKYQGNLGTGATTLYSCPTGKRARLGPGMVFLHNPTGGGITADLHHVPSGGSAGSTNKLAATITVASNESRLYFASNIRQVLLAGDALVINTGGTGLNAWLWALEERQEVTSFISGFVGNLGTGETTLITVPALRGFYLDNLVLYNTAAGTRTLTAYARESGVSAGTTNEIAKLSPLTVTGTTLNVERMVNLTEGGIVSGKGDNTGLNVWASGTLV
jgi:hypothetical protein